MTKRRNRPEATTTNTLPVQVEGLEPFDEYVQRRQPVVDGLREAVRDAMSWVDDERALDAVLDAVAKHRGAEVEQLQGAIAKLTPAAFETLPDLQDRIDRALALHVDAGESQGYVDDGSYGVHPHACGTCGSFGEYGEPWPCMTVKVLTGADQ